MKSLENMKDGLQNSIAFYTGRATVTRLVTPYGELISKNAFNSIHAYDSVVYIKTDFPPTNISII